MGRGERLGEVCVRYAPYATYAQDARNRAANGASDSASGDHSERGGVSSDSHAR